VKKGWSVWIVAACAKSWLQVELSLDHLYYGHISEVLYCVEEVIWIIIIPFHFILRYFMCHFQKSNFIILPSVHPRTHRWSACSVNTTFWSLTVKTTVDQCSVVSVTSKRVPVMTTGLLCGSVYNEECCFGVFVKCKAVSHYQWFCFNLKLQFYVHHLSGFLVWNTSAHVCSICWSSFNLILAVVVMLSSLCSILKVRL